MQTLVLNASYEVMKIVSWQQAVKWFFLEKVDIIEEYSQDIHAVSFVMKMPSVVKFRRLVKPKFRAVKFSRLNVYARDKFICQYCTKKFSHNDLTLDHVTPRSKGGPSSWTNCVSCCVPCNVRKADRSLKEAGMKLLNEPRQPSQKEMFALSLRLRTISIPPEWKNYSLPNVDK